MSQKLIFHIGLHKTATTFFQNEVFPTLTNWNYLNRPFIHNNFALNKLLYEDDTLYDPQIVRDQIASITGEQLLFSSENLTGQPWMSAINRAQIARRLREISDHCEIILFIRGQKSIIYSHYNNFINNYQGIRNIEDFVWKPSGDYTYEMYANGRSSIPRNTYYNLSWFNIHVNNFLYYPLIKYYKQLFGERMHVFLYETFSQNPDEVFNKLETVLDEKIHPAIKEKARQKRLNRSVTGYKLHKKLIVNKVTAGYNNRYLNKLSEKAVDLVFLGNSSAKDSPEKTFINELVDGYYVEDNRKIIEEFPEIGIQDYPETYEF